jgi:hypothetical protein
MAMDFAAIKTMILLYLAWGCLKNFTKALSQNFFPQIADRI